MEVRQATMWPIREADEILSHSFRFEHKLGPRLKVVALIDPSVARAEKVLEGKRQSFVETAYRETQVFRTIEDYHAALKGSKGPQPQYVNKRMISSFSLTLLQCDCCRLPSGLPWWYHQRYRS